MAKALNFYIKERENPQLGTYYVPQGQMTKKEAETTETGCLYGCNIMHAYTTKERYEEAITQLKAEGKRVQ